MKLPNLFHLVRQVVGERLRSSDGASSAEPSGESKKASLEGRHETGNTPANPIIRISLDTGPETPPAPQEATTFHPAPLTEDEKRMLDLAKAGFDVNVCTESVALEWFESVCQALIPKQGAWSFSATEKNVDITFHNLTKTGKGPPKTRVVLPGRDVSE